MTDKLKPCPFCGSAASMNRIGHYIAVACSHCDIAQSEINIFYCKTDDEVDYQKKFIADKWNTRTNDKQSDFIAKIAKQQDPLADEARELLG